MEFAEQNHVFDGVIAASDDLGLYKQEEGVELFYGAHVTPGTFEFFGMPARYGRVLQPEDYQPGAPPVFVMRHKTWLERFNGDPGVLNKTFVLNGTARTLIGIMPSRFAWYEADILIPRRQFVERPPALRDSPPRPYYYPNYPPRPTATYPTYRGVEAPAPPL